MGSGFKKITDNSYLYSGKPPIFEDKEMFRTIIPLLRDKEVNGTLNGTLKLVLEEIKNNNRITQKELSENTKIPLRTIKRSVDYLKQNGYIKRVGSKKSGYWEIL